LKREEKSVKTRYGNNISTEIVEVSKYSRITAPIVKYRGDRGTSSDLSFEWSCITQPLVMDAEPEVNENDQFLLFTGSNIDDFDEFQAEIELPIGKEKKKQIITGPTFVYIPKGLVHGPVKFSVIGKPVVFWNIFLDAKYSENWVAPEYSKYLAKPKMISVDGFAGDMIVATHGTDIPFRYIKTPPFRGVTCWCNEIGLQANLSMGYTVVKYRDYCVMEPVHYHRRLDEWVFYMGGNPLDVGDFDADVEMFWGREHEKQVIDSTCVCHIPPGMVHIGNEKRRVGKPILETIFVAGTGDYYRDRDKVLISKEEEGEVMISEGANDWVPVTRE
jgi:hypothetical protein